MNIRLFFWGVWGVVGCYVGYLIFQLATGA